VSIKSQLTLSKYWVWFFSSQYQYQYQFLIVNISTPNKSYCFYIFFHTVTFLTLNSYYWVGVNCSNCDCSTRNCSTLLAGNQLLDTFFVNCSNPVNPG
jgi:hypothetical protein